MNIRGASTRQHAHKHTHMLSYSRINTRIPSELGGKRREVGVLERIKREPGGLCKKGVGVVRDNELKLEDGKASHTLGAAGQGGT